MALKIDRNEYGPGSRDNLEYFMNETATAGHIVVHVTSSSGTGGMMDDADALVKLADNANGSGETPAGMLLQDVVNLDLTRQHINQYKRESQVGGKVRIARGGVFTVNTFATGYQPAPGDALYFTTNGQLTNTSTNSTQVGRALGSIDSDGYAKIEINIV